MKKFTSLFALLALVFSASADTYSLSVWYETSNQRDDMLPDLYFFIDNNTHTTWPGNDNYQSDFKMTWVQNNASTKVYKWEGSLNFMPDYFIFSYKGADKSNDLVFVNGGYYIDGAYDHSLGKTGYTVYYDNSETSWWSNVYVYTWHNSKNINSGWTRYKMESLGNNLYSYHVSDEDFSNLIFNNGGSGGSNQTVNSNSEAALAGNVYIANGQIGNNDNYNVIGAGPASLVVTDGSNFSCAKNYTAVEASYSRTISDNWGTLCLPFAINKTYTGITFYQLSTVDTERKVLSFTATNSVEAGMPVVFKASGSDLNIKEGVVPVSATTKTSSTVVGWELKGSFARMDNYTPSGTMYFFSENQFWSGTPAYIPAYRAWFDANVNFGANPAPFRIEEADAEGLQFVEQEDGTVKAYYDLQGRKLDCARKGLVIENGKIIMVK